MRRLEFLAVATWAAVSVGVIVSAQAPRTLAGSVARSSTTSSANLRGGPHGVVKNTQGFPVEGLMVQLISHQTSIRTTVYTNELGRFEFPRLDTGDYVLRLARPLEFRPYRCLLYTSPSPRDS